MFGDFGFSEMFVVVIVGVLLFGRDLPKVARKAGRVYNKFKRQFLDVRGGSHNDDIAEAA